MPPSPLKKKNPQKLPKKVQIDLEALSVNLQARSPLLYIWQHLDGYLYLAACLGNYLDAQCFGEGISPLPGSSLRYWPLDRAPWISRYRPLDCFHISPIQVLLACFNLLLLAMLSHPIGFQAFRVWHTFQDTFAIKIFAFYTTSNSNILKMLNSVANTMSSTSHMLFCNLEIRNVQTISESVFWMVHTYVSFTVAQGKAKFNQIHC